MRKRKAYNPKRRVCDEEQAKSRQQSMHALGRRPRYSGNPEHKRNPGDFGLDPPSSPRLSKTLCDSARIYSRAEALELLGAGLSKGLFSIQERGGWPQNVWAVTSDGHRLEAQLEGDGTYHGYPMPQDDPLREEILSRWKRL
jgi:hypothetical protein